MLSGRGLDFTDPGYKDLLGTLEGRSKESEGSIKSGHFLTTEQLSASRCCSKQCISDQSVTCVFSK
jgi:hypothetical protein